MWNQSNTSNTFGGGGGGFGQPQPTNNAPSFGSPFGAAPAPSAFGAPAASGFGGTNTGGGFGTNTGGGGLFSGAQTPAPAAFGGGGFASSTTQQQSSVFGSTPAPGGGLFSPAPAPAFGAPSTGFGGGGTAGGGGGGLFGSSSTTTPAFGSTTTNTAPFGTTANTTSAFGGSTSVFGGAPSPAPAFGATPAPSPGGFFNNPSMPQGQQQQQGGTRGTPFTSTSRQDGTNNITLHSISAMQQYQDKSHEELRFEDYSQGNRGSPQAPGNANFGGGFGSNAPAPAGGLFGNAPAPQGGSLFGQTPAPASTGFGFGSTQPAPSTGLFGSSTPAPATFGSPAPSTGLFGAAPAPTSFGAAPAPSTGLFGQPSPAPSTGFGFGSNAPAPSGGIFGSTSSPAPAFGTSAPSTSLFGQPSPAPAFGAPAPGGLFSSQPAPASSFGFGAGPAPAPTGGLFGQPAPAPAFGAAPAAGTSLFGQPSSAPTSVFGGFGQPAPAPTGLFGGQPPAPAQQSLFAQAPPAPQIAIAQPQPLFPPNAQIVQPAADAITEQRMRAMENQRRELENMEVWRGSPSKSTTSTPTNNQETSDSFFSPRQPTMSYTPRSTAKIRPRGFPKSEPPQPAKTQMWMRDNSSLMSPEAYARSSQLKLHIRPDSLKKKKSFALKLDAEEPPAFSPPPVLPVPSPGAVSTARVSEPAPQEATARPASTVRGAIETTVVPIENDKQPPKSPGYEYYQQVIGRTTESPEDEVQKETTNGFISGSSDCPKLTKSGYEVTPSITQLSSMSEADLAAVKGFKVARPEYGMVEWEGCVDVRGADLDHIVVIEHRDVSVYTLDEQDGTKPDEGSKLNRPAKITFYDIYPKNRGAKASKEAKLKFAEKIEKTTKEIGAEFISYDIDKGIWKIRVQHFSRYALVEDEDSDEDNIRQPSSQGTSKTVTFFAKTPGPMKTPFDRKATPYNPSRICLQDEEIAESSEFDEGYQDCSNYDTLLTDTDKFSNQRQEAEKAALAILESTQEVVTTSSEIVTRTRDSNVMFDNVDKVNENVGKGFITATTIPSSEMITTARTRPSFCIQATGENFHSSSSNDFGRRFGRSFRSGWSPDCSITHFDVYGLPIKTKPVIAIVPGIEAAKDLLEVFNRFCVQFTTGRDGCPLYSLKSNEGCNVASECSKVKSLNRVSKCAFTLISDMLGSRACEIDASNDSVPLAALRVAAAYKCLVELCSPKSSSTVNSSGSSAILEAISCGDIELACDRAVGAGDLELATLLASGLTGQADICQMLGDHTSRQGDSIIQRDSVTSRIIRNAAGEFSCENDLFHGGDKSLSWAQRLALRLLQKPDREFSHVLFEYARDADKGDAPFPGSRSRHAQELMYRLLRDSVDPFGYDSSIDDFALAFHLVAAISASNRKISMAHHELEYICNAYSTQLIVAGSWVWAVFVTLFCVKPDCPEELKLSKVKRAKEIVLAHFNSDDSSCRINRDFLTGKLAIPTEWFSEAQCYRASASWERIDCVEHALGFNQSASLQLFEQSVLPNLFFERQTDNTIETVQQFANGAPDGSLVQTIFNFMVLSERVKELSHSNLEGSKREPVTDLITQCNLIQKDLETHNNMSLSKVYIKEVPTVPSVEKAATVSFMIAEALRKLVFIKTKLELMMPNNELYDD